MLISTFSSSVLVDSQLTSAFTFLVSSSAFSTICWYASFYLIWTVTLSLLCHTGGADCQKSNSPATVWMTAEAQNTPLTTVPALLPFPPCFCFKRVQGRSNIFFFSQLCACAWGSQYLRDKDYMKFVIRKQVNQMKRSASLAADWFSAMCIVFRVISDTTWVIWKWM